MAAADSTGVTTGKVAVGDGTLIHYQHYRQASSSQCVVLVHSLALNHRFWRLVAPAIAAKAHVVCVDVRGHGQSGKPPGPSSIELFAQDVKEVLQALGYRKAVVAGASLGGCVALQFAIDHPEMTAALGLVDTTSWYGPTAPEDWSKRAQKAKTDGLDSMVQFQASRWFSEQFRTDQPELLQQCVDTFLANDVEAYGEACRALGGFNASTRAAQVNAPTAVVVGANDYAAPVAMSQYLHESIQGSTLTIIPEACHLTPIETPDVIVNTLERLLEGLDAQQGQAAAQTQGDPE